MDAAGMVGMFRLRKTIPLMDLVQGFVMAGGGDEELVGVGLIFAPNHRRSFYNRYIHSIGAPND
jgi:hypothetical protein